MGRAVRAEWSAMGPRAPKGRSAGFGVVADLDCGARVVGGGCGVAWGLRTEETISSSFLSGQADIYRFIDSAGPAVRVCIWRNQAADPNYHTEKDRSLSGEASVWTNSTSTRATDDMWTTGGFFLPHNQVAYSIPTKFAC